MESKKHGSGLIMIIEIDSKTNVSEHKIGVLGIRSNILIEELTNFDVNKCIDLKSENEINKTFDFIFVSGYYKIIPDKYINKPKYGIYCFHESPLPEGRGHAPIQWAVLNQRKNLTISMFKIDSGIDTGLISQIYNVPIDLLDTYHIIDQKRRTGIKQCFNQFLLNLDSGFIILHEQSGSSSYHNKRTPDDSELDKMKKLVDLWDNIRICDNEKFPAFFKINKKKIILRYEVVDDFN